MYIGKPKLNMKSILLLIILFYYNQSFSQRGYERKGGTTIIAIFNYDSVIIAADSRQTHWIDTVVVKPNLTLKIRSVNEIHFAMSGNFVSITTPLGVVAFDAYQLMSDLITQYNNIDSAFSNFNIITKRKVDSLIKIMPSSVVYQLTSKLNTIQLELLVVTYQDKNPVIKHSQFAFTNEQDSVNLKFLDMSKSIKVPSIEILGIDKEINEILDKGFEFDGDCLKENLVYLIKTESLLHPDKVGEPINVISISPKGFRWL